MTSRYKTYPILIDGSYGILSSAREAILGSSDEAKNFEARIRSVLDQIDGQPTGVGHIVLSSFPKEVEVRIIPYLGTSGAKKDQCNAYANDAGRDEESSVRDVFAGLACELVSGSYGKALVSFSVETWKAGGDCNKAGTVGANGDEVLFHEMLHAYHTVTGKKDKFVRNTIDQTDQRYDNAEEFFAIVIANMYQSQKTGAKLRKDHHGFEALPAKWQTSVGFLSDMLNKKWIHYVRNKDMKLVDQFESSTAIPFNPFREYVTNTAISFYDNELGTLD